MRHPDIWQQVGLNILYYRKQKRLPQMQLAERCRGRGEDAHISRNYIQRIETGISSCTLDTLIDIADALEVSLAQLMEIR